jgi:hypothetical protein
MISFTVPTRNRPGNLRKLYQSLADTTDNLQNIELCFYVDEDDSVSLNVIQELATKMPCQCVIGEPAPDVRVATWHMHNELQKIGTGPYYMFCADDVAFRTKGWDTKILKKFDEFPDKIALVYAPDGFQGGPVPVCTHGFIHKNWIDTVGYLFPPYFQIAYNDTWLTEIAEMISRRCYLTDVYIEHVHPAAGKAAWDHTYTSKQESAGGEANIFNQSKNERVTAAEKLKTFIENYEKQS